MLRRSQSQITAALRQSELRCTPQRYFILKYLLENQVHATADEICRAVNRSNPHTSRATVYNSLRTLVRARLVQEVPLEGKAARFDANVERHHHFVCDRCGRLEDIEWFDFPALASRKALGRRMIRGYQMLLRGVCESCLNSAGRKGTRNAA